MSGKNWHVSGLISFANASVLFKVSIVSPLFPAMKQAWIIIPALLASRAKRLILSLEARDHKPASGPLHCGEGLEIEVGPALYCPGELYARPYHQLREFKSVGLVERECIVVDEHLFCLRKLFFYVPELLHNVLGAPLPVPPSEYRLRVDAVVAARVAPPAGEYRDDRIPAMGIEIILYPGVSFVDA